MATKAVKKTATNRHTLPAGPGRPKGIPNKVTGDVKAMILEALHKAGGADYLLAQSESNPTAFMTLVGKVLPTQVTGDPSAPITLTVGWRGQ